MTGVNGYNPGNYYNRPTRQVGGIRSYDESTGVTNGAPATTGYTTNMGGDTFQQSFPTYMPGTSSDTVGLVQGLNKQMAFAQTQLYAGQQIQAQDQYNKAHPVVQDPQEVDPNSGTTVDEDGNVVDPNAEADGDVKGPKGDDGDEPKDPKEAFMKKLAAGPVIITSSNVKYIDFDAIMKRDPQEAAKMIENMVLDGRSKLPPNQKDLLGVKLMHAMTNEFIDGNEWKEKRELNLDDDLNDSDVSVDDMDLIKNATVTLCKNQTLADAMQKIRDNEEDLDDLYGDGAGWFGNNMSKSTPSETGAKHTFDDIERRLAEGKTLDQAITDIKNETD